MKYALNIADLTTIDVIPRDCLVAPNIKTRTIVKAEQTLDGGAVLLDCGEEQAQAIVEILRLKYKKHEMRCYRGSDNLKSWKRI